MIALNPRSVRGHATVIIVALFCAALIGCQRREETRSPVTASSPAPAQAAAPAPNTGPAGQASYADIVSRVAAGVVTIHAGRRLRPPRQHPFLNDPLLRQFFGDMLDQGQPARPRVQIALGSGVVVQRDGTILTNHHVIDGAEEIKVELTNHRVFDAKVVGSDPPSDIAVLKVSANDLDALSLGDSDRVRVGDIALAIGNPLGIGQTVTMGIISAKGRATGLSDGSFEDFLQTDAAINQGNSGGALINTNGELIGINSQILSPTGGNIGIGFSIPSNMARVVMNQLIKTGKVRRGQLGVSIQPMTPELTSQFGLSDVRGVIINDVVANGPAARAGLRQGDVILAVDGTAVTDGNTLRNRIASTAPGTDVTLTIFRDKREQQVHVQLGEYQPRTARAERGE